MSNKKITGRSYSMMGKHEFIEGPEVPLVGNPWKPATLVIGPGKVFTEEEVKAILTKGDEVIECYFDTYGHMGGDAHDLQEKFRDIVLKHGLTL